MDDRQAIQMMSRCTAEIKDLRTQINYLRPKAEAYDAIVQILGLLQRPGLTMGEDVLWILKKETEKLEEQLSKPEPNHLGL